MVKRSGDDLTEAFRRHPIGGHGAVYRWLRDHRAEVAQALVREKLAWHSVAAEIAAAGVLGARGEPPTGNAVRRVWKRLCRDLVAEEARVAGGVSGQRTAATRAPSAAPGSPNPIPATAPAPTLRPSSAESPPAAPFSSLTRARRILYERSGRNPDDVR